MTASHPHARSNRKGEILQTFTEMVAARGYDAVSIRDVAEALSMSKGTILHHFNSKDRLLEQVHANYMTRRLAEADEILQRLQTPPEQLSGLIHQNFLAMHYDRPATVAFAREIVRFAQEDIMTEVRSMRRAYSRRMREVVQRGMDEGSFRRDNATLVTLQIFGMFNWSWTWLRPAGEWTVGTVAETFVRTIIHGMAAGDGAAARATSPAVVETVRAAMAPLIEAHCDTAG